MDSGVIYVAYGHKARNEARQSITSLQLLHNWPVLVVGDAPLPESDFYRPFDAPGTPGRWAKVNLDKLTPWEHTLFLDADTRIHGDLSVGFRLLEAGWDVAIVPSRPQHNDALRHLDADERRETLRELPADPLQLNTGVMWFGPGAAPLFEMWREEWTRWKDKDQGALLRALQRCPVKVALVGQAYNDRDGAVVDHRFGACG
jgi:hypothetical protein